MRSKPSDEALRNHLLFVEGICTEVCARARFMRNGDYPEASYPPVLRSILWHETLAPVRELLNSLSENVSGAGLIC